jgi:hypothetical protein
LSNATNSPKRSHPCKGTTKAAYLAHRKKHVKLWQASGRSKSDYAAQLGVSKDTFYDWTRDFGSVAKTTKPKQAKPTATLVPVRIQAASQHNALKLTRTDGSVLEWREPPQATWLAQLLKALA